MSSRCCRHVTHVPRVGEVDDDAGSRSVGVGRARDGDVSSAPRAATHPAGTLRADYLDASDADRSRRALPAVAAGHARADARGGVARRGSIVVLREWGREAHRASDFVLRHVASARPEVNNEREKMRRSADWTGAPSSSSPRVAGGDDALRRRRATTRRSHARLDARAERRAGVAGLSTARRRRPRATGRGRALIDSRGGRRPRAGPRAR